MSSCHPSTNLISQFANGELDDVMSIMLSAHIDHCEQCHTLLDNTEAELADEVFANSALVEPMSGSAHLLPSQSALSSLDVMSMLDEVVERPAPNVKDEHLDPASLIINIHGREVKIPKVVSSLSARSGPWTRVTDKLWRSPVTVHGQPYQIDFIYMEAGGTIPKHTHRGNEVTLVLDGDFADENGTYGPGAMITCNDKDNHTPYSNTGCLCLAAIDAPLHFVSGFARLLNPFSNLFFKTGG
ncbi:ChrR family anti-sigma-E factor [Flocculibacter collagenilyticus]|uniref:ChrR family anti-sigma-E factor n=1 Tax=Flocculibacter collagenilyticus TaxID=2744479 RepID=UPI0018F788A7|nr:ChrR family anti-sigma-E factor [Flocculibacter collagenilyticus]